MKRTIRLTVNGQPVAAEVEPRLQLAELLREQLLLTGTHLGCEHGVCGACTIELDGAPARSCIAYAVACDGASVRTIEGFEDDAPMAALREAFSAEHALQCGFCTPGMLVSARDIVLRLPDADEARIRHELAGNLCRCTGYVGIVRAIQRVLAERGGIAAPAGAHAPRIPAAVPPVEAHTEPHESAAARAAATPAVPAAKPAAGGKAQPGLRESFTVGYPRERVGDFFGRLDEVVACLPGAAVAGTPTARQVDVTMRVKLGPIVADFEGAAEVVSRDPSGYSGVIRGSARDRRSSSMTRGEIRYALAEAAGGAATHVDVEIDYALSGTLAQFGRSGIVRDIARRMTAAFARNLEARLGEGGEGGRATPARPAPPATLDAGSLVLAAVRERIRRWLRALKGR